MKLLESMLRYYFITDEGASELPLVEQVRVALNAGATLVQYRNKAFTLKHYSEVVAVRDLCRKANVPLVINDHILLAKAVAADGVHLGQEDEAPSTARQILGADAIVGLSVSTMQELARSSLDSCDYIGNGPVFGTQTKTDAKPVRGLEKLSQMTATSPLPVVAIGGISATNAGNCIEHGAAGVAVISAITRAPDPSMAAHALADAIGMSQGGNMFCPQCRTEYREGFTTCADCKVDLVTQLPPEQEADFVEYEEILSTYNPADIAVIKSLMDGEGLTYYFKGDHLTLRPMGDAARLMVIKAEAATARELLGNLELSYSEASSLKGQMEDTDENDD